MAVRATMANLITRTRLLINDTAGASQVFADNDIQDVLDESRQDLFNFALIPQWTYSAPLGVFDYFAPAQWGAWEDDLVLKQYLTTVVSPSVTDNIVGHWKFAATTLPPVFITGKTYDIYRSAADLLERWAAKSTFAYNVTVNGQNLHREGASTQLLNLAKRYRMKQRVGVSAISRSDIVGRQSSRVDLGAREIDYMGSG
jgi:hypothetical protein